MSYLFVHIGVEDTKKWPSIYCHYMTNLFGQNKYSNCNSVSALTKSQNAILLGLRCLYMAIGFFVYILYIWQCLPFLSRVCPVINASLFLDIPCVVLFCIAFYTSHSRTILVFSRNKTKSYIPLCL